MEDSFADEELAESLDDLLSLFSLDADLVSSDLPSLGVPLAPFFP